MLTKKQLIQKLQDSYQRHRNCEHCDTYAGSLVFELGQILDEVKEKQP